MRSLYLYITIFLLIVSTVNPVYAGDDGLYIVTTFPFLSDIASNILGDAGRAESLIRFDRHVSTYELTPQDSEKIWLSDLFIYVGYGSEEAIGQYALAIKDGRGVISLREFLRDDIPTIVDNPYFWMDPMKTVILVERLANLFGDLEPNNREVYIRNAEEYIGELRELDRWIRDVVNEIPEENRILFSIRDSLRYYAERYGFEVVGYITGGAGVYEPSTTWVVQKFEDIVDRNVNVLFIEYMEKGTTLREVIETLADEAGVETVGFIFIETLSYEENVTSYIDMMRRNTLILYEYLNKDIVDVGGDSPDSPIFDNPVLRPFKYGFLVRGFLTLMVVMALTSLVGSFAVLRGWSIFSDALGHGAIVGLLMAYLLGLDYYLGALLIGLFIAFSVGTIERVTRLRADVVIAITFTSMLAIAIIIISNIGGVNISLEDVLFADVTAVSIEMMWRAVGSALAIGSFVILFRRQLLLYSVDPMGSISLGIRSGVLHFLYLILLAVTTVSAFMSIGAIPAIAAIILPPAASFLVSRRPKQFMVLSLVIGIVSGLTGFYASYYLNVNAGAATIMTSVFIFLVCVVIYIFRKPPTPEVSR